jgi:hypothetical protein
MLLNFSNHPSSKWSEKQRQTAIEQYGRIQDMAFPNVPPSASSDDIKKLAYEYIKQIRALANPQYSGEKNQPFAIHIMGEMTLIYRIISFLKRSKITCLASTSERNTVENEDGSKTIQFEFIQFREYV